MRKLSFSIVATIITIIFCSNLASAQIVAVKTKKLSLKFNTQTLHIDRGTVETPSGVLPIHGGSLVFYSHEGKQIKPQGKASIKSSSQDGLEGSLNYPFGVCDVRIEKSSNGRAIKFHWNAKNKTSHQKLVTVALQLTIPASHDMHLYNGRDTISLTPKTLRQSYRWTSSLARMPLLATYWRNDKDTMRGAGLAMGLSATEFDSNWVPELRKGSKNNAIVSQTMHIVLDSDSNYDGTFVLFGFSPNYKERDAYAVYYSLYPKIFFRRNNIDQRIYGASASYSVWRSNSPEIARRTGADWDWCIDPFRRNGDIADTKRFWNYTPVRSFSKKQNVTRDQWLAKQKKLFERGQFSNVAMMFYVESGVWCEYALAKNHFPDAMITDKQSSGRMYRKIYGPKQDDAQAMFSWKTKYGNFFRESLKKVSDRLEDNISGFSFDTASPTYTYRGPALKNIKRKSWDNKGTYAGEQISIAHLMGYVHKLHNANGQTRGVVANVGEFQSWLQPFHTDTLMIEGNPWRKSPPFPLQTRYAMGEKSITWWEGWHINQLFNLAEMSQSQFRAAIRGLADYTVLRSIFANVTYSRYFSSGVQYAIHMLPLMKALNKATWRPILGFKVKQPKLWLSRYGGGRIGKGSPTGPVYLTIGNPTADTQSGQATVFAKDLGMPRGTIFAEFFGHKTKQHLLSNGISRLSYAVPTRKPRVYMSIMSIDNAAKADIDAQRSKNFDHLKFIVGVRNTTKPINLNLSNKRGNYKLLSIKNNSNTITFNRSNTEKIVSVKLPKNTNHHIVVDYQSMHTNLTQNQILSVHALTKELKPQIQIWVNKKDKNAKQLAKRLKQFYRNYIAYKKNLHNLNVNTGAYSKQKRNLALDIPIKTLSNIPSHQLILHFGKKSNSTTVHSLNIAHNGPWITGNPKQNTLELSGSTDVQLQTILYSYMDLLSSTQFSGWYGTISGGAARRKAQLVPMTLNERKFFNVSNN